MPSFGYVAEVPGVMNADVVVEGVTDQGRLVGYTVLLRTFVEGEPQPVRLFDNAHAEHEHHMHRYSRDGIKHPPETVVYGSPSEALNAALDELKAGAGGMIDAWRR